MNRRAPHASAALGTIALSFVLGAASMSAQAHSSVIGSGAVSAANAQTRLSATIGQSAIGFTVATFSEASQGFWFSRTSAVPFAGEDFVSTFVLSLTGSPNPLSRSTTLSFHVPDRDRVSLVLYDAVGRQVMTVIDEERDAGPVSEQTDLSGLPSGSYTAVLRIGDRRGTASLLLVD